MTEGLTLSKDWTFSPRSGLGGLRTGLDCGKPSRRLRLSPEGSTHELHSYENASPRGVCVTYDFFK